MSIFLIVCIVALVFVLGLKLRRGTFFWWSGKKDTSTTSSDRSDHDDRR
jgi:hypothetical protein